MSTQVQNMPSSSKRFGQPSEVLEAMRDLWMATTPSRRDGTMVDVLEVYLRELSDLNPEILMKAIRSLQRAAKWFPAAAEIRCEAYYFEPDRPVHTQAQEPHQPTKEERIRVGDAFKEVLAGLRDDGVTEDFETVARGVMSKTSAARAYLAKN